MWNKLKKFFKKDYTKFFYGIEKRPLRMKVTQTALSFLIMSCSLVLGYGLGFAKASGTDPFSKVTVIQSPSNIETVSSKKVDEFVRTDGASIEKYDVGFNCVEFALLAARNAHWKEISATVVQIDFEDGSAHWVIGFPTTDEGWKFMDPQSDLFITPRAGGYFVDKKIIKLSYLSDFVWIPLMGVIK